MREPARARRGGTLQRLLESVPGLRALQAGDDAPVPPAPLPPLPTRSELAASVRARESVTFPCRFESRCVQTALAHTGAPARWTELLWIGKRLRVLRIVPEDTEAEPGPLRGGIEALEAFDGTRLVVATRHLPAGAWHGSLRVGAVPAAQGRALASFFLLGPSRLGDALESDAATVRGWTTVGDVRCVLVEASAGEGARAVYALDPTRGCLPRAVWCLAGDGETLPIEMKVPCTDAEGAESPVALPVVRSYLAVEVDVLPGDGAPYPAWIRSAHDPPGGVHVEVAVRPRGDGEDEAVAGTEGAGLAGLMPEGGTLLDAATRQRIEFGREFPARGAGAARH